MDQTDVQAVAVTSSLDSWAGTTAAIAHPTRVKALWIIPATDDRALVEFFDGTSATAANEVFEMTCGLSGGTQGPSAIYVLIPENGVRFNTSVNVKVTNNVNFYMTIFYG